MSGPTPWLADPDVTLYHGDALDVLRQLPDESVDCVATSPPYWGLRDYGTGEWEGGDSGCDHAKPTTTYNQGFNERWGQGGGQLKQEKKSEGQYAQECAKCGARRVDQQLGLEPTPDLFVQNMVSVFREVRRVLAPHGTCWVNLGDSYNTGGLATQAASKLHKRKAWEGLKPKDLVGIPWRVAFALQADGWFLRSDIIWAKPNPMPESVTDRPTKSHEYVFLLTKQPRYWFDAEAVREPAEWQRWGDQTTPKYNGTDTATGWMKPKTKQELLGEQQAKLRGGDTKSGFNERWFNGEEKALGRNVRSVWTIATQPYPEAHFATFPEELARRCIVAGCPERVCRVCGKPAGAEVVRTPLGNGHSVDPTMHTGRKGMNRVRRPDEGTRPITKAEQREYARQLRESPYRTQMERETGPAFAHYIRTDDSGARPLPPDLLAAWLERGWLAAAEASGCGHNDYRPGVVLDPFIGSGTTAKVARDHQRHAIGIDLNEKYLGLAARRLQQLSLLNEAQT